MSRRPALLMVLLSAGTAAAQAPASAPAPAGPPEPPPISLGGRVVARHVLEDLGETWTGGFDVAYARLEVRYRWKDRLLAEIETELRRTASIRNAYVRLALGDGWRLRAGFFKSPFSAIQLESSWTLPVVDRGLVTDVVVDRFQVAGRRAGAQVEWNGAGALQPRARLGLFQGDVLRAELEDGLAERVVGRASLAPGGVEIGLNGEWRSVQPVVGAGLERFWAAGLDKTTEVRFPGSVLRAWAEVIMGSSPFKAGTGGGEPIFVAARLYAAWRHGGLKKGKWYVEPVVQASAVDPDADIVDDLMWELGGGLNGGQWDRWRAQLQVSRREVGRNAPAGLGEDGSNLTDRTAVIVQLGAAF